MNWKKALEERQEIVLSTSSTSNVPHAIMIISLGIIDDQVLIGACLMKTTLENIKKNNKVSMVTKLDKEYYRIEGEAKIYSSGKYFDIAYKKSSPPMPKYAILINIKEVFDLGKQKKIV